MTVLASPSASSEWRGLGIPNEAAALNLLLVRLAVRLYRMPDRRQASSLFHYSMLYLALLFLFLAVDRSMQLQNPFLGRPGAVIRGNRLEQ